jgi:hypothetical protein
MALVANRSQRICAEIDVDCPAGLQTSGACEAALTEHMDSARQRRAGDRRHLPSQARGCEARDLVGARPARAPSRGGVF